MIDSGPPSDERKIQQLPSRVISGIVEHLKDHSDHVSLLLLCKRWSKTVAEAMYRAPPLQTPDSFERLMGLLNTPLPSLPYPVMIRELDISGIAADNLYMGDLDATLGLCPNLEVFRLEHCFHISNILVQSLAHHCPNLLQLDLPGCPISDSFVPALTKKCRHLLRLDFSFTNVTIAAIHPIIMYSESLLELDLSECREADDLTLLDLSNKGYRRSLKSLNLRNTPITDDLLRFAASQCPDLEIIILESCPKVTDDAVIKIITACPRLRSLDCSFCDRITDLSLNALTVRAAASNGGTLEELYFSACDLITPNAVHQMVQKTTRLELLVLDGCEKVIGSYIQDFTATSADDLECTLEGEALNALATYSLGSTLATPPASPGRPLHDSEFKVEVSYQTHEEADSMRRRKANSGFAAAYIRSGQSPGQVAASIAAAKEANAISSLNDSTEISPTGTASSGNSSPLQRRSSRTLRHRRSLLGLSARVEDGVEDAAEAAKLERQEKIREKRRSRTSSFDGHALGRDQNLVKEFNASRFSFQPPVSPASVAGGSSITDSEFESPPQNASGSTAKIDEEAARAAFLAAAAAKGVKVAKPSADGAAPSTSSSPAPATKRTSTLSLKASEFVPSGPSSTAPLAAPFPPPSSATAAGWNDNQQTWGSGVSVAASVASTGDSWNQAAAPKQRKLSVGTPAGPPNAGAQGSWITPVGISASAVISPPPATPPGLPQTSVPLASAAVPAAASSNGETPVLLFSGRAARAASLSQSQAPTAADIASAQDGSQNAPVSTGEAAAGAEGGVLIASGRRRGRTNSLQTGAAAPEAADDATAGAVVATLAPEQSTTVPSTPSVSGTDNQPPSWINQPAAMTVPPQAPTPWGTDPAVWNNPAQLTSSSSTWSTANPASSQFVDPWSRPSGVLGPAPVTNSTDPWAAPPPSATNAAGIAASVAAPSVSPVKATTAIPAPTPAWQPPPPSVIPQTPQQQQQQASATLRMAASAGWTSASQQAAAAGQPPAWGPSIPPPQSGIVVVQSPTSTTAAAALTVGGAKSPRPGTPGFNAATASRFGSVGATRTGSWSSTSPTTSVSAQPAPAPLTAATNLGPDGERLPFEYSSTKRGRMLLKLKIETKTGGHQTLAVHELDDPLQLATEFVTYWDMAAFKEPLVRLISVRKTNVLRSRGHH